MRFLNLLISMLAVSAVAGCAGSGSASTATTQSTAAVAAPSEPIGLQIVRAAPELKSQRFNNLLSFETASDPVFVSTPVGGSASRDSARAHTGARSLKIEPGTQQVCVKVSSLVAAGSFPAKWTLLGGYIFTESPAQVTASYAVGGNLVAQNRVDLKPGKWTPVMVDVKSFPAFSLTSDALVQLTFDTGAPLATPLWCDDVMLIDNTLPIVTAAADDSAAWTIQRRGLNIIGELPGRFTFALPSREYAPNGWRVVEAGPLRARFLSSGSTQKATIYSDGRAYWDGQFRPLGEARLNPAFAEQHASPAEIEVPEEQGRVNRNTPGDANNDGYNEVLGSYQLVATAPRMELTIVPRSAALLNPVLEITGLPKGQALISVEGRLLDTAQRLDDDTLIVCVPARLDRLTAVSIRVQ
jgi:hypothetical protein